MRVPNDSQNCKGNEIISLSAKIIASQEKRHVDSVVQIGVHETVLGCIKYMKKLETTFTIPGLLSLFRYNTKGVAT